MDAIKIIGVSDTSVRVVLTSERMVYQGRWQMLPVWFDVKGRDRAYIAEYRALACWYRFTQAGQGGALIFVNECGKGE